MTYNPMNRQNCLLSRPLRIIALSGPKYSGKDTACKGLVDLNYKEDKQLFRRAPMAEGVKNIVKEMFGWGPELYEDPILKEKKLTEWPYIEPRWPLMDIANWLRDKYGGDIHARRWERVTRAENLRWGAHVMTDMRFPEEVEMVEKLGGIIIYISRPEAEKALANAQASGDKMALNPSEIHYAHVKEHADYFVENTSTPEKLQFEVAGIVSQVFDHWKFWGEQHSMGQTYVKTSSIPFIEANGAR